MTILKIFQYCPSSCYVKWGFHQSSIRQLGYSRLSASWSTSCHLCTWPHQRMLEPLRTLAFPFPFLSVRTCSLGEAQCITLSQSNQGTWAEPFLLRPAITHMLLCGPWGTFRTPQGKDLSNLCTKHRHFWEWMVKWMLITQLIGENEAVPGMLEAQALPEFLEV